MNKNKETIIHSYPPEGSFKGEFRVTPVIPYFGIQVPEQMLPGKDTEQRHPEWTLATALLTRHPLMGTGNWSIVGWEVQQCPQGVFQVTDKRGQKHIYALRAARHKETGRFIVLTGLSDGFSSSWGFWSTRKTDRYNLKVTGKHQKVVSPENAPRCRLPDPAAIR